MCGDDCRDIDIMDSCVRGSNRIKWESALITEALICQTERDGLENFNHKCEGSVHPVPVGVCYPLKCLQGGHPHPQTAGLH